MLCEKFPEIIYRLFVTFSSIAGKPNSEALSTSFTIDIRYNYLNRQHKVKLSLGLNLRDQWDFRDCDFFAVTEVEEK